MKSTVNSANNLRVDRGDFDALQGTVDEQLRLDREAVIADVPPQGLIMDDVAWEPTGIVCRGWTTRVNPGDDQQVLVTPGVAVCYQNIETGEVVFGQITAADATERPVTISGDLEIKGLWVKYTTLAGTAANRARWRPDESPEREQVFLHNTRLSADSTIEFGDIDDPPDASGWFKIADVDYTGGNIVAADIADRRVLLFEGQATGTANPSTAWEIPDFNRGASRGTLGAQTLHGFAMMVLRRLIEVSGRPFWHDAPVYGENTRSASGALSYASDTTFATAVHRRMGADDVEEIEALMLGNLSGTLANDGQAHAFVRRTAIGTRSHWDLDVGPGGSILLINTPATATQRTSAFIEGPGTINRTAGGSALFTTGSGTTGYHAAIRGMKFAATNGSDPLWWTTRLNDSIIFEDCVFDTSGASGVAKMFRDTSQGGHYVFRNCQFVAASASNTDIFVCDAINTTATFINCAFSGGRYAFLRNNAPAGVIFDNCRFDDMTSAIKGSGFTGVSIRQCISSNMDSNALDLGGSCVRAALDNLAFDGGEVAAGSLRAVAGVIFTGPLSGSARWVGHADVTGLTAFDSSGNLSTARFESYRSGTAADNVRLQRSATEAKRWVLTDVVALDAPVASEMHAFFHRFGGDSSPDSAKLLSMHPSQVPLAWGSISKAHGAPGVNESIYSGSFKGKDLVTAVMTQIGSSLYHQWQIGILPDGEGGIDLTKASIEASMGTSAIAGAGGSDLGVTAEGVVSAPAAIVFHVQPASFKIQPQIRDAAGAVIGPLGDNFSTVDDVPTSYMLFWCIWADASNWGSYTWP